MPASPANELKKASLNDLRKVRKILAESKTKVKQVQQTKLADDLEVNLKPPSINMNVNNVNVNVKL